jgi:hypothetical protein
MNHQSFHRHYMVLISKYAQRNNREVNDDSKNGVANWGASLKTICLSH